MGNKNQNFIFTLGINQALSGVLIFLLFAMIGRQCLLDTNQVRVKQIMRPIKILCSNSVQNDQKFVNISCLYLPLSTFIAVKGEMVFIQKSLQFSVTL